MMQFDTTNLEQQLYEFRARRFLAFPLAGTIAWAIVGVAGIFLSTWWAAMTLFIATGSIVYLGLALMRVTGEHVPRAEQRKNTFDTLFFLAVASALLVYAIAIPFFILEPTSLPLSVGILTGLMWLPTAWLIGHWAGIFHAITRTAGIVVLWYLLPNWRFVAIPFFIVAVYAVTMIVLEQRWRRISASQEPRVD
ncbi:MAG: hypothetical protein PVI87_03825 [Gammaproteobacteria bacterium]|jgi:hypothetical protein